MKKILNILLVAAATLLLCFTSCKQEEVMVGEPYFELEGGASGLDIDCLGNGDANPSIFKIRSNQKWQFVPNGDYDWVFVYPVDGGNGDGMVRFIVNQNLGTEDRVAYFTILVNGEEQPSYFTINQQKDSPRIKGAEAEIAIEKMAAELSFAVASNVEWEVKGTSGDTDADGAKWFTVKSFDAEKVHYSVTENTTYDARTAVVTVASKTDAAVSAEIKVTQSGIGAELEGLYVDWVFSADDAVNYKESFETKGRAPATNGVAFLDYVRSEESYAAENGKTKLTIGGTGHPYVTGAWLNDYWLFTVPSVDIPAGTIVNIKYLSRSSATGFTYWMMELYDGDAWVPIGEVKTATDPEGNLVEYNQDIMANGSDNTQVDVKATYQKNTNIGKIMIRMRAVSTANGSGAVLKAPNGGTNRIAGDPDNRPSVQVLYVGDGSTGPIEAAKFEYEGLEDKTLVFEGKPADTLAFTMTASMRWTLEGSEAWIHATPDRGNANEPTEIRVAVDTNLTDGPRRGVLKVSTATGVENIVVVQSAAPGAGELDAFIGLSTPSSLEISERGEQISVGVISNAAYDIVIPEDCASWVSLVPTISPAADVEAKSHKFDIAPNKSGAERFAVIKFVDNEAGLEAVLNIHQLYSGLNVIYYESVGEVSGTTKLANIPWTKSGSGAATVSYTGGSKIDARKTCNQGSTTSNGTYDTYLNALMSDAPCTANGNIYFGNDDTAGLAESWFQINDITLEEAKYVRFGMGMYNDIAQADIAAANPMIVAYKFDNESDFTILESIYGTPNWHWYSLPAFAVPSGATKLTIRFQATHKQHFRIDDLTLIEAKAEDVPKPVLPASWTFSAADMAGYTDAFQTNNACPSLTSGDGYISYYSVVADGLQADPDAKFARIVGGTGHPYITGGWPGDYWLFDVPKANIIPDMKINIKFITRTSATGHKFWMLEYLDGDTWKPAADVLTESDTGQNVQYTHAMNSDGTNVQVDATITYSAVTSGVKIRFRCMANWQASGKGALEKPNGGTSRIAGDETGTSPIITVVK